MTAGVLLLNATFEPLGVVKLKRAMGLIASKKVDIIEEVPEKSLRSEKIWFPYPSVVKLRYYVHVPYRPHKPILSSRAVLIRDDYVCCYCLKEATTMDHVIPRSKGGEHSWLNVVAACRKCNAKKGNSFLDELDMKMNYQPLEPAKDRMWLTVGLYQREQWLPYLEMTR